MKNVRYEGEDTRVIPSLGVEVGNGDVIEVPDDFTEANFSDTTSPVSIKVIVPPTEIPAPNLNAQTIDTKDAGATDEKVAVADTASATDDAEKGV